jgi:hypothetical protein
VEWPAGGLEEGRREKLVAGWIQGVWGWGWRWRHVWHTGPTEPNTICTSNCQTRSLWSRAPGPSCQTRAPVPFEPDSSRPCHGQRTRPSWYTLPNTPIERTLATCPKPFPVAHHVRHPELLRQPASGKPRGAADRGRPRPAPMPRPRCRRAPLPRAHRPQATLPWGRERM